MSHLPAAVLIDMVEQRLSEPVTAECKAHLDACSVCATEYQFWWQFNSTLASEQLVEASEQLIQRCISIFPGAPPESGLRQVIGRIVFDSFFRPAPAIRGESVARQMVIRAEEIDIHLRITGSGARQTIHGQLLPLGHETAISGACINLLALGRSTQSTTADELGVFEFRDVPKAQLIMCIKLQSGSFVAAVSETESNTGG